MADASSIDLPQDYYGSKATDNPNNEAQPPPYDASVNNYSYGQQNLGYVGQQPLVGQQPYGYHYGMQDPSMVPINQQPGMGGPVIVSAMPGQGYVIQPVMDLPRPPSYLVLSCIVFWLVNLCFGAIAMGFSFSSQSSADRGDMVTARRHGHTAKNLSIAGAAFTVAFVVTFVIVMFAI